MKNDWKHTIKNKMEGFEQAAPEGLFDDVIKRMEAPVPAPRRKYSIWKLLLPATVGIAAVLLLLPVQNTEIQKSTPIKSITAVRKNGEKMIENVIKSSIKHSDYIAQKSEVRPKDVRRNITTEEFTLEKEFSDTVSEKKEEKTQQTDEQSANKQVYNNVSHEISKKADLLATNSRTERNHNGLNISISLSGLPENRSEVSQSGNILAESVVYGKHTPGAIQTARQKKLDFKADHRQPLNFGINLQKSINEKISIESGISYSHHKSDITYYVEAKPSGTTRQDLYFIGIPLNLNYNIWSGKRSDIYINVGGAVEKMIDCRQKSENEDFHKSLRTNRLFWSAATSLGAQYRLTRHTGLYIEPGISYHFDNGSNIRNIYNDRPLRLEFKAGLRFRL